ncbi:hypothetical protein [Pectobacterium brasiliense]|uniref:hypothetical protein n=1 Tax=Pectobacterium brasiliense TaxID=180957 RepID=UPI001F076AD5|nr:hypothetical protein [Pectobacterium brasiliense]
MEPGVEDGGDTSKALPKIATGKAGGTSKTDDRSNQNAIAYLLLRVEKLKNFPKIKYKKLDELYERYHRDSLTESDFILLNKLIDSKSFPEYSLKNLQAIYACEFWINQFLKLNQDKDLNYVEGLKNYLHTKLALTSSQISGLNKWFDNSSGRKMVKLKPNPFVIDPSEYWKKD